MYLHVYNVQCSHDIYEAALRLIRAMAIMGRRWEQKLLIYNRTPIGEGT